MAHIVIKEIEDESDCETCGSNWANGFEVIIDGEVFGDYTPSAVCTSLTSYNYVDVYRDLLEHFGHTIKVDA